MVDQVEIRFREVIARAAEQGMRSPFILWAESLDGGAFCARYVVNDGGAIACEPLAAVETGGAMPDDASITITVVDAVGKAAKFSISLGRMSFH